MELPVNTTSALINELMEDLKNRLENKEYGEVGLNFVIHNSTVVRYEKVDVTGCQENIPGNVFQPEVEDMTTNAVNKMNRRD